MGLFSWFTNKQSKPKQPSYEELYGYTLSFIIRSKKNESFGNFSSKYKNYTLYSMDEEDLEDFYNLVNCTIREIFKDSKILIEIEPQDKLTFQNVFGWRQKLINLL
ncbi:MAG: hypothetical protein LKJ75_04060 [Clostridia bacterium]|nr:hypothetical protein [Clostridia bacterium]MCI2014358.1 hypothetical protein [Clostridia bacterium]